LIYLVFGTLWIVGSDSVLDRLALDSATLISLQTIKGTLFVLVTGGVFFFLVYREIERQRLADQEAHRRHRALQSLFEATFEHAPVGMSYNDSDGRYLRVNRAYCRMVGYSEQELLSMRFQDITHPEDLEQDLQQQKRLVDGETDSFEMDKRYVRKDGSLVWATLTTSAVPDPNGGERHYLGVINDVTDRKTADAALRASEARFRALVEQSITGIYVFDDEAFRYANQRLADMFGYSVEELVDRLSPFDLIAPEDEGTVRSQIERRMDGRAQSAHYSARGLRKDGTRIWLELHGSRLDIDGRPAITGTALDITERVEAERRLRDSEARFRSIYEEVNDAIFVLDPMSHRFLDINRKAVEMIGYAVEEARGLGIEDISFHDRDRTEAEIARRVQSAFGGEPQMFEWHARDREGRSLWIEINMRKARIGDFDRVLLLARDITGRRRSEERLRLTSQVVDSTREGVVITDTENRILSVNPAFTEITGYTEEDVLNKTPQILQSGFHDRSFYRAMWHSIEKTNHWQGEIWNRRKSGETYPEWLTISAVRDEHGTVTNYVGVFTDVSRLKHSEAEVQRLAHYDPLTNFPNRVLLMTRLEHALELGRRNKTSVALMFCGLDRFKYINDSMGYPAGDELLQAVSRRIRSRVQRGDTLARFGGDEFVILLESDRETDDVAQLAQSIVQLGEKSIELSNGQTVFAGLSVGVSTFPTDGEDTTSLITHANAAMQQAKVEGRHTYRFYTEGLTEAARQRLLMESRLRQAVENREFELYYQPIVSVADERIVGAEALLRWNDPELGVTTPDRFIPLAEETGLIVPLGRWVLDTACREARQWNPAGREGLRIAVNLSSRQFEASNLTEEVASILDDTGLVPGYLELEITESVLMEQGERSVEALNGLRELGVSLCMDDFGTGYSSLAYLKRFAIGKYKIDGIFIKDLPREREDVEIVSTMIIMAHNLNLQVVAEQVETPEQLAFLKAKGCDEFQGYLVSPAVPAEEFRALIRNTPRQAGRKGS
jgi:diguanylate cyclase (GGDEF)-like protein/PAS domain S-box-containing protein